MDGEWIDFDLRLLMVTVLSFRRPIHIRALTSIELSFVLSRIAVVQYA